MALQSTTALANITLQSPSNTVTFSNIPQEYRDLVLFFDGAATAGTEIMTLQVNNDTASNYPWVRAGGNGSSTFSSIGSSSVPVIFSNNALTSAQSSSIVQIFDYTATDKHKNIIVRENNNAANPAVVMYVARWANTSAINFIRISLNANSFEVGSAFSLYGRIA
jgi:hypothetical protein